ncbi:MAG: helix-turn-helix transcriptional regulator [Clostridia bacterium]|nr:helix-turn-helix transcriptional regulator [Clostridia bacterium]
MELETTFFFEIEHDDCAFCYKTSRLYPGYADDARSHDELKLVHIMQGEGLWQIGGREYTVAKDDIIMLSSVDERRMAAITSREPLVMEQVKFLPMTIYPMQGCADIFFERREGFRNVLARESADHAYLLRCFADLRTELSEKRPYQREYIVHTLMGMVIAAARLCSVLQTGESLRNDGRYSIVCRTMVYIKKHLSEDLSREVLARKHGVHPSYLSRLFKEYSGICLQDYIVRCRVQNVIFLMKTKQCGVLTAALDSGFTSSSGFYRAFHKVTGQRPKDVLKKEEK